METEVMANEIESDAEEGGVQGEMGSEVCERVSLEKEEAVVKRVLDPCLPSREK